MKSTFKFSTVATVVLMAATSMANAQTIQKPVPAAPISKQAQVCTVKQTANAELLARASGAKTPVERLAILKAAIDADPENAPCIADLALQMALAGGISPAAGPEDAVDFNLDGAGAGENPNQLGNGGVPGGTGGNGGTPVTSPNTPAL